ncbi:hypothetical protein SK128_001889 [Halocaridina rubra]|uniref:ADAMTS cysteine-rich domain-containing protein n=1 Tax=Halocaridina rubra TaxID=373956 RepID=A0AAN8WUT6_HALRR
MSPSTGPGKVTWSKCSNSELKDFLENSEYSVSCLEDLARGPRELDFSDEKLPGELYTVGQQCTYALGSTFKPYVTSKFPYNGMGSEIHIGLALMYGVLDINEVDNFLFTVKLSTFQNVCRETWCQNTTHAMRTHPALEGTSCGVKKFCVNGQCVAKPPKAFDVTDSPRKNYTTTTSTTTATTTTSPARTSGFRDFFRRIRNLFQGYLQLRDDLSDHVLLSKWTLYNQSTCSAACGGGWQESLVSCSSYEGLVILEDEMCDPIPRPPTRAACNTNPCVSGSPVETPPTSKEPVQFPRG